MLTSRPVTSEPARLAAGGSHTLMITPDGRVMTWGLNGFGQLGNGSGSQSHSALPVPVSLGSRVTPFISGGGSHSVMLTPGGKLLTWGENSYGQLGQGNTQQSIDPKPVQLAPGVSALHAAAGGNHTLAVGGDGRVYSWGNNGNGQLGLGDTENRTHPTPIPLPSGVRATLVAAGDSHSLAITSDGKLFGWGRNRRQQLGSTTNSDSPQPVVLSLGGKVAAVSVAAGYQHTVAAGADGRVHTWGDNGYGQHGIGNTESTPTPTAIQLAPGVRAKLVAAGYYHSAAVGSDGKVYVWGYNGYGQIGNGTTENVTTPHALKLGPGIAAVAVAAGYYHTVALGSDGNVYAWGSNRYAQLGTGNTTNVQTPQAIALAPGVKANAISAGYNHTLALGSDGRTYVWGYNRYGQLGDGTTTTRNRATALPPDTTSGGAGATAVAAGAGHSIVIGSDGKIYAWGQNDDGQVGNGTTTHQRTPTNVPLPAGIHAQAVATGLRHSAAIGSDGKIYTWGSNASGQLGAKNLKSAARPQAFALAGGVLATAVGAGFHHTTVVGTDGRVHSWGQNDHGQLGVSGGASTRPVAVALPGGIAATHVAAGAYHTLAIGSTGQVFAWGHNGYGQLGNASAGNSASPVAVALPEGLSVVAITAGYYHSAALASDGQVYTWGHNAYGQLGNGSTAASATPTATPLAPGVRATALAAGYYHTVAHGSDGKIYMWGLTSAAETADPQ